VRKVLGASVSKIILLLNVDYLKLMFIAILISWPLAWWGIHKWLNNYSFRILLNPWLFIIPALLILLIATLTVSLQTLKAANTNPVNSLRNE
jgi:putative ABC transport system permease protein